MLTYSQARALEFIESEMERTGGVAPTLSEIAMALNYKGKSGAARVVEELERRGFISRIYRRDRSIAIIRSRPGSFSREKLVAFKFDDKRKILVPLADYRAQKDGETGILGDLKTAP
jgi:SOS-response transcriptional repressor LexA